MTITLPPILPDADGVGYTARDLATKAMQDRKIIGLGVTPKARELDYCVTAMNLMFRSWAAKGLTLWTDEDATATVTSGDPLVAIDPRAVDVNSVSLLVSAGYERPMARWEKGEYSTIPNKAQAGDPLIYTPVYTFPDMAIRIWPVPTANKTLLYSFSRAIDDVTNLSAPVDLPRMWFEAVVKCLAARLDVFGDGGDPTHLGKIVQDAATLERQMFDHDRPASYQIGSDYYA